MEGHVTYIPKSSESEGRQVLSIGSQLKELRRLAADRGLAIAQKLIEKGSAREPARPVFDRMTKRVRAGDGLRPSKQSGQRRRCQFGFGAL